MKPYFLKITEEIFDRYEDTIREYYAFTDDEILDKRMCAFRNSYLLIDNTDPFATDGKIVGYVDYGISRYEDNPFICHINHFYVDDDIQAKVEWMKAFANHIKKTTDCISIVFQVIHKEPAINGILPLFLEHVDLVTIKQVYEIPWGRGSEVHYGVPKGYKCLDNETLTDKEIFTRKIVYRYQTNKIAPEWAAMTSLLPTTGKMFCKKNVLNQLLTTCEYHGDEEHAVLAHPLCNDATDLKEMLDVIRNSDITHNTSTAYVILGYESPYSNYFQHMLNGTLFMGIYGNTVNNLI